MEKKTPYNWKFTKVGGVTRISIESGADIAHLDELDQKMWTVLSCPTTGLEFDEQTLKMMDTDNDGKIRVHEVVGAAKWITSVLKNPDILIKPCDELPLGEINQNNEDGKKLYNSAKQILGNLGLQKDSISLADTSDSTKIFADTKLNGDGIITEKSTDDAELAGLIKTIGETTGTVVDRSGEPGVTAEKIESFYKSAADFAAWMGKADSSVMPYGDKTGEAFAAYTAIKDKVDDFFVRCKLAAFNEEQKGALEMTEDQLLAISGQNLATNIGELAKYPVARVSDKCELEFDDKINPAWQGKIASFRSLVGEKLSGSGMSEGEWTAIGKSFDAYKAWLGEKAGTEVESLGTEAVRKIVEGDRKAELLSLVAQDEALADEANEIAQVDKLLHLYKNFFLFLRNFVTFSDFYSSDRSVRAIFQAGTLYIDQRSCDLCIKVSDMGKHDATAAASGMFLIYCDCTSKSLNKAMKIVAVMTDGDVDSLRVGKNAIFYDRDGNDWDATVTKIIDNPISIRQAFWSPYRKFGKFINDQISKFAQEKDQKMTDDAMAKISESGAKLTADPATADTKKQQMFDIAKFCGILAAVGLAIGSIGGFLTSLWNEFMKLSPIGMVLALIGIVLVISGPSMLLAWMSLRKRNLSPLLNANGWAVNAQAYVNIVFGATLTKMAAFPMIAIADPFADKGVAKWKIAVAIVVVLAIVFALLYFNNFLRIVGLPYEGSGLSEYINEISGVAPADTTAVSE